MYSFNLYISGNMSDCKDFVSVLQNKNSLYYQPHIYDLDITWVKDEDSLPCVQREKDECSVNIRGKSDVGAHDTFFGTIKPNRRIYTLDKLSEIFKLYTALNFSENGFVDMWTYNCGEPWIVENKNLRYENTRKMYS